VHQPLRNGYSGAKWANFKSLGKARTPVSSFVRETVRSSRTGVFEGTSDHPVVKQKGTFTEISWEQAFDIIADKLTKIKNQYGAKAIVPFRGNGFACRESFTRSPWLKSTPRRPTALG
jgi:hypothetical protein